MLILKTDSWTIMSDISNTKRDALTSFHASFKLLKQQIRVRAKMLNAKSTRDYHDEGIFGPLNKCDPASIVLRSVRETAFLIQEDVSKLGTEQLTTTETFDILEKLMDLREEFNRVQLHTSQGFSPFDDAIAVILNNIA